MMERILAYTIRKTKMKTKNNNEQKNKETVNPSEWNKHCFAPLKGNAMEVPLAPERPSFHLTSGTASRSSADSGNSGKNHFHIENELLK